MSDIDFPTFLILWNKLQRQSTPATHLKLASWLAQAWERGDKRLLVMAFRAFGKSTIVGIFCTWVLWRNPDLRILILAADLALARKMVRNVKRIIEKHPLTRHLKPEKLDQWGSDRFTLNRKSELRDPSMLAKSIMTNLTGTRADIIICDDVEVPKTCETSYKREELRQKLIELDYILTQGGTQIYVGTPHTWETIYADAPRRKGEEIFLRGFKRKIIPVLNKYGESEWPERFSLESIRETELKTGPTNFLSQMMCEPVNITDGFFDVDNIEMYEDDVVYSEAGGETVLTINDRRMISAVAWWDPAFGKVGGDKSVIAIVYQDKENHYWLHHLQAIMIDPRSDDPEADQQCVKVAKLMEGYFVPLIAVETNGLGTFLPTTLQRALDNCGVACKIERIANRKPKNIRIQESLESIIAARALHVHREALQNSLLRELQDWSPHKKNQSDDALDAVAGAVSLQPAKILRTFTDKRQKWPNKWTGVRKMQMARTVLSE